MKTIWFKIALAWMVALMAFSPVLAQERVRINFYKGSPGDIDLVIRDLLVMYGYDAFVDYGKDSVAVKADYVIDYTATNRATYDELHKYTLRLYKDGLLVNEVDKTISYFNTGVSVSRELSKGLSRLLKKRFDLPVVDAGREVKTYDVRVEVLKIDDGLYLITAKGVGASSLKSVREVFFNKAGQYLTYYDYFVEEGKYSYSAPGGGAFSRHTAHMVMGIVRRNSEQQIVQMESLPADLLALGYFDN